MLISVAIVGCEASTTEQKPFPSAPLSGSITRRTVSVIKEYPTGKLWGPLMLTLGSEGDIYFTAKGPHIGRMTKNGSMRRYYYYKGRTEPYESTFDITLGPDANVWFTDFYGETVGTIRNDRVKIFQPFAATLGGYANTAGIITGPNHHLWLVRPGSLYEVVDEMTTQPKVVSAYAPSGSYCWGEALTATPDGTIWEGRSSNCPTLVRITPGKRGRKIREFPLPQQSQATSLASMPDGTVWFANCPLKEIGRTTNSGQITWFPTPDRPDHLVASPDGTLWFSEPYVGRIANMTTSGAVTEYTIPNAINNSSTLQVLGIALDKDGTVWFTEPSRNKVGHLIF